MSDRLIPKDLFFKTRSQALKKALELGITGAHKKEEGFVPGTDDGELFAGLDLADCEKAPSTEEAPQDSSLETEAAPAEESEYEVNSPTLPGSEAEADDEASSPTLPDSESEDEANNPTLPGSKEEAGEPEAGPALVEKLTPKKIYALSDHADLTVYVYSVKLPAGCNGGLTIVVTKDAEDNIIEFKSHLTL